MDYSPSPSRVKPQYAFLDNSIEIGRSEKPFKSSPLKNVANREDTGLHEMQKKFYSKYSDLKPQPFSSMKPSKSASNDSTNRLFKEVSAKVPVDDEIKISSNMIEKIIRENERLKHDKDLVQTYAKGLKEKLLKYKQQNESLKAELVQAQQESKDMEEKVNTWKTNYEQLQNKLGGVETVGGKNDSPVVTIPSASPAQEPSSPQLNNTQDIFGSFSPVGISDKPSSETKLTNQGLGSIESRIKYLEHLLLSKNGDQPGSIKDEISFLKKLMIEQDKESRQNQSISADQMTRSADKEEEHSLMKEDEWLSRETFELNQLQSEVMNLHKKLAMREDNMRKKSELKRQLLELSMQLERADEPSKKTKSSLSGTSDAQHNESSHQSGCHEREIGTDLKCTRCAKAQLGSQTPSHEASTDIPNSKVSDEPKHFHINGVKWY